MGSSSELRNLRWPRSSAARAPEYEYGLEDGITHLEYSDHEIDRARENRCSSRNNGTKKPPCYGATAAEKKEKEQSYLAGAAATTGGIFAIALSAARLAIISVMR